VLLPLHEAVIVSAASVNQRDIVMKPSRPRWAKTKLPDCPGSSFANRLWIDVNDAVHAWVNPAVIRVVAGHERCLIIGIGALVIS
jgi:hypothetical protein